MKKKETFSINENRLKEIMANGTNADGSLKQSAASEGKAPDAVASQKVAGANAALSDRAEQYRKDFLSRKDAVHRKQTYICYDTYRRLARILPLLSDGMTVPAFLDNVLNHHLKKYEEELDEMVRLGTQNSR